ncbi:MAG: redoxin domain-containing protein [Chloroflexi bacterium]|nr:redoxin domain-containing protein [Chloroflexota bacterium]MBL7061817.1 redoxin domain-containing protein [Dehalococcoidia bacterium]
MTESDNVKPGTPRHTTRPELTDPAQPPAAEPEEIVKKAKKRGRRPSAGKKGSILPGHLQKILAAAIILCLGLVGFIIFILARDTTPPVIQQVSLSDMAEASAIITWQTDEPATSQVTIWDSEVYTSTEPDETLMTNHSATLSALKPNTRYQLILISRDKGGNEARLEIELTTPLQPYAIPPIISGVKVSNITDSSATITWQTDMSATSQIEYGTTNAYGSTTPPDNELTTSHSIALTGLKPSTTYYFEMKSQDAGGNEATSETRTFITLSSAAAAVEIGVEAGKRAPDFTLLALDSKALTLSQFRGKIVMVNFWQESCSACRHEMPYLQAIYEKWPRDKLEILAISVGDRAVFVQNFVDRQGLTLPTLLDSDEAVSEIYQIARFPTTFFINADGIIKEIKEGRFTSQFEIEDTLNSL